jgi:mannose-6-phosphate isomerase-like protein (cupin superfamily)
MPAADPFNVASTFLRLRPDSSVEKIPAEGFWARLMGGELGDFRNEYIVVTSTFSEDWSSWEIHPNGDEVVFLLSGRVRMILETPGGNTEVVLEKTGDFAFVPRGTWHTGKTNTTTTMFFITAGAGTRVRPA